MWYVYILECNDLTLYTGITNDLNKRISTHNNKKGAKYTKSRTPVKLIYYIEVDNRSTASMEECRIKKLTRKEKLNLIDEFQYK